MATITELKEPVIELVKASELNESDLFRLNYVYKTDRSEFVICDRGVGSIIINADHEAAAKLKELTKEIISIRKSSNRNKAVKRFRELTSASPKADIILHHAKYLWQNACNERKLIEQTEVFFGQIENSEKANKEELMNILYDLGFKMDISPKDAIMALTKEEKFGFIYGYMMGLKAAGKSNQYNSGKEMDTNAESRCN